MGKKDVKNESRLVRMDKALADSLVGSRREVKRKLAAGLVRLNGEVCRDPAQKIDPQLHRVEIEGRVLCYRRFVYIMMNKPAGVLSATKDSRDKTALSLLPEAYRKTGLFIAGRLDKDTEGFLLITNDGPLGHGLTSPGRHADKRYYVKTDRPVTKEDAEAFAEGVTLGDGTRCRPAGWTFADGENAGFLTLREGKFHQVKRMMESRGKKVTYLRRTAIGGVALDPSLAPGAWRELTPEEAETLKKYG